MGISLKRIAIMAALIISILSFCIVNADTDFVVNEGLSPINVVIQTSQNSLEIYSDGEVNCYGITKVDAGYDAKVRVQLQQMDGVWRNYKSWSDEGGTTAIVDIDYSVDEGYKYRLKVTHEAYDSDGIAVEAITTYSDVYDYR